LSKSPANSPIHLDSYLTTERSLTLKQIEELYRGGYINAGEAADLVLKYTDFVRVEVPRARRL
jgi:hypothetical protein